MLRAFSAPLPPFEFGLTYSNGRSANDATMDTRPLNPENSPSGGLRDSSARARILVDGDRIEWEVYDESQWDFRMALDWDVLPQTENPGLIFSSRVDRRRVWPAPPGWQGLTDEQLLSLCANARSMF